MGLATEVAAQNGVPLPLGAVAESLYAQVVKEDPGLSRKDFSSVYQFLQSKLREGSK
jgi:3-hydroxyisobutyrate dehydrogenase